MYLSQMTGQKFCFSSVAIVSTVNEKTLCCLLFYHVEVSRLDVIAVLCLVEINLFLR